MLKATRTFFGHKAYKIEIEKIKNKKKEETET